MRRQGASFLPLILLVACGSPDASKLECQAAYDHVYRVAKEDSLDRTGLPGPLRFLQGEVSDFYKWIKNDKGKMVRNCQVTMTRKDALRCLEVRSASDIERLCDH